MTWQALYQLRVLQRPNLLLMCAFRVVLLNTHTG